MKRFFLMWGLVFALLLSGCGSSASRVETLKSWSFQYNEGTSDYSLFFGLADKNDNSLSADVDVDIRIVNDADEEVYTGTKSVSPDDFSYYSNQAAGEQYLANVRIPAAEIKAGTSASGKVYFTVYKENAVQFDEVNCDALYCLPIEDVQVTFDSFPLESSASRVETLKSWSFQYNEGTSDYSLFFGLADKNDKSLSADVDVDIRIVNDADEEVYAGTKSVSTDDFGYYTSQAAGEQYLANVRIPSSEIKAGKSASGKVYFTVYKENAVQFDEVNCDALYCLPIEDVQVTFDSFPLDLKVKDFMGSTASVIQIQGAEFKFDKDYSPHLTIAITGEKKSGSSDSGYDMISYKLYDSAGYLVDSGNIYLSSLSAGDKFKDDSVVIYDITPGESYTFQLSEYSW